MTSKSEIVEDYSLKQAFILIIKVLSKFNKLLSICIATQAVGSKVINLRCRPRIYEDGDIK